MKQKRYWFLEKKVLTKVASTIGAIILVISIMMYDVPADQSWSNWSLPLSGYIFVLDAGHGSPDGGANTSDGVEEKDITLRITKYLRDYLNEAGALVIMTREKDGDLASPGTKGYSKRKVEDLKNRVSLANSSMGDFFISIHLNSIPEKRWRGAQTIYHPVRSENKMMAKLIQEQLKTDLKNTDRRPLAKSNIIVLKYVKMPSVMVEVGFLSNPEEARLLQDTNYQKKVAFSIYQGILTYYSEETTFSEDKNH